jgi:hypothetical protein
MAHPSRTPAQNGTTKGAHAPKRRPVTMEGVTTAIIVVTLVLLGLGIVINELFRLRTWLKNSPPPEPPDENAAGPPEGTN